MKFPSLIHSIYFMLLVFGGIALRDQDDVTNSPPESSQRIEQSTSIKIQPSETTVYKEDDVTISNDQSTTQSSETIQQSDSITDKLSDTSVTVPSSQLEPSIIDTLDVTSQDKQTETQSSVSSTAVKVTASVTAGHVDEDLGDKSDEEPTQLSSENVPVNNKDENIDTDTEQIKLPDEITDNITETIGQEEENQEDTDSEVKLEPGILTTEQPHTITIPDPGTGGAAIIPETEVEKHDEEGLTFNEWTLKVLAEAEKGKQVQDDDENIPLPPVKQRKKKNYAAHDCGAKILTHNPEATNAKSVLNSNKDEYMINPCKAKKWFVIELCEPIQTHSVEIASLELFSSQPKQFKVYLSDRFPTKDWKFAGEFFTKDERIVQSHEITETLDYYAKYVRVELVDHFGDEHFCPLTLFRVLGIAVGDFEDHVINDDDDDDDDDNDDNDKEEGSKNLFTSAKDTVMDIVKKVLNVDSDTADVNTNISQPNTTNIELNNTMINITVNEGGDTMPCTPSADIPIGGSDQPACEEGDKTQSAEQPQPAEPGRTDSVIVIKLKDDEQVETSDTDKAIPLSEHLKECYKLLDDASDVLTTHGCFHSKLCEFVLLVYQVCHPALCPVSDCCNNKKVNDDDDDDDNVVAAQKDVNDDDYENKLKTSDLKQQDSKVTSSTTSSDKIVQKSVNEDSSSESTISSIKATKTSKEVSSTQSHKASISSQTTNTVSLQKSNMAASSQTGSSVTQTGIKLSESRLVSDTETIDPTPTLIESSKTTVEQEPATPQLPEDWKPQPKDLNTDGSTLTDQSTNILTDKTKMISQSSPVSPDAPVPPTVSIATESSVTMETIDNVITDDDLVAMEIEAENLEQKSNTTVIDEKVVVSNGGGKKDENVNLVRVPTISSGKRESAIMRLSNRIKVLEQNVSLSSRFLEELSRRYKKQSEDMMKMLNKTMAQLYNVTVEADVKNKIHEDEVTALEARLENLTKTVNKLTHSFDNLNRQVTDRQMIWTTIEIIIIIIIVFFLYFRRKQVTVPQEMKALIEAMPAKPEASLPIRRNSLSGPPTPSKEKAAILHKGGGLQRFSSETALGSVQQDYNNTTSTDVGNKQGSDVIKRKKKKKHKGSDLKLHSNTSVPFHSVTGSLISSDNSSQQTAVSSSQSNNFENQSGFKNSVNVPQCSKSKCFYALTSCGVNGSHGNKGRSASFDTSDDKRSLDEFVNESQVKGHCDVFDSVGTFDSAKYSSGAKMGAKGPSKKPPLPGGSKQSPKLAQKSVKPGIKGMNLGNAHKSDPVLEEKWVTKGHRRQKSLPKMPSDSIENIGPNCKKTKCVDSFGCGKNSKTGFMKNSKRDDKSQNLSESNDGQSTGLLNCGYTNRNGHSLTDQLFDSEQMDRCYSLEKSQSDIYLTSSYGRCPDIDGYANSGAYEESLGSVSEIFTQNGADCLDNEEDVDLVGPPVNVMQAPPYVKWKNIFDYFR
ncbi:hypothetical protein ACF0H5_021235 [Mactra antiquata]